MNLIIFAKNIDIDMKKIYLIGTFLLFCFVHAQTESTTLEKIVNTEKISASKMMNMSVNPNTLDYDITYHRLDFTVDPSVYFINGVVTTTYTALSDMNTITFDLANELTVSDVKQNNVSLSFLQDGNNQLIITLPATQLAGTSASVVVTYSGAPPVNGFDAFTSTTHNGVPVIYTLSEPYGARDWWPCKQDLNDKVNSIDVYITAPSQYIAVSNGVEPEAPVINGTSKTTHFHHGYPIPAYLICMAVTNYSIYNQTAGTVPNTFPIINYIYPEDLASVQPQLAQTPLLLNLYNNLFEIYPFHNEKYGHAEFGWGGGMEHTTVSFMVGFARQLIAHEMAHQWFGDKVTCGSWKDIWLNEGFATYVASMVYENFDSPAAFVNDKANMVSNITSKLGGAVYLTDTDITNVNRIFDSRLTYNKGAMVLEMLRFKLGDAAFFQGLREYLDDPNLSYAYAHTTDLQAHLESVYGSSLTEFFNDWIYNQGYPSYTVTAQNIGGGQVQFVVNQTQSNASVSFFEMPVPIRVFGVGGQQLDLVLNNTTNGQVFVQNVPFAVTSISFDPNVHLISKNNTTSVLSTTSFDLDKTVEVFPNPTSDELNIKLPNIIALQKVIIYNTIGQKITENNSTKFSVSSLETGVYTISIETSAGIIHKKFIKK